MRCKNCKEKFEIKYFNQKFCMLKNECIKAFSDATKVKLWQDKKKVLKAELKTLPDHLKECQKVFNKYIRLRDGNNCISCKNTTRQIHAGHYRSVGAAPHLRFNELNVHSQCSQCNNFLSANLIEYRINLIQKIGVEKVESLENNNETKKYSITEVQELTEKYKKLCKELNKQQK